MNPKKPDSGISDLGEKGWIDLVRKRISPSSPVVLVGPGDDAAVTRIKSPIISTTDLLIEDVHFIRSLHPPRLLGRKALSVNLSDVAAMAGRPRFALLSLGLPPSIKQKYARDFIRGFLEVAHSFGVELIGGDTTSAEKMTVSVTVLAELHKQGTPLRSRARAGDAIYITGCPGDASLGMHILLKEKKQIARLSAHPYYRLIRGHLDPTPRLEVGQDLAGIAHSMIDLSDGLVTDLGHLLEESRTTKRTLSADIEVLRIPLSNAFKKYFGIKESKSLPAAALRFALQGGEDYELLFTASGSEKTQKSLSRLAKKHGVPVTRIGVIRRSETPAIKILDSMKKSLPVPEPVFEHFSGPQKSRQRKK